MADLLGLPFHHHICIACNDVLAADCATRRHPWWAASPGTYYEPIFQNSSALTIRVCCFFSSFQVCVFTTLLILDMLSLRFKLGLRM
jgi:hypothetical protein